MDSLTSRFSDLRPVDSDTHFSEPHDLWTSRAPAKYRERVPRVEPVPGQTEDFWVLDGRIPMFHANGHSFVNRDGAKEPFFETDMTRGKPWEAVHPASYDVTARLEFMDKEGVWAQIVYPNVTAFALGTLLQVDQDLATAVVAIYNDAMAEWQAASNGRLYPQAMIPFWDMRQAVRECERVKHELGLTGILLAGEPHLGGLPDLGQTYWDPLYEAVSDFELPINIHVATSIFDPNWLADVAWPSLPQPRGWKPVASVQGEMANSRFLTNILLTDVLIRWPETKWVSVESGIGWIPFALERVDYEFFEEFPGVPLPDRPTAFELFHRQVYSTFWFERSGPLALLDHIGVDNVMWETDFPHPQCLHPDPVARTLELLSPLPDDTIWKLMQTNACDLYGLNPKIGSLATSEQTSEVV